MTMADETPPPVVYMRRYVYTHYSTGKPRNVPWVTWQMVKNPKPGDFRYERGELVREV